MRTPGAKAFTVFIVGEALIMSATATLLDVPFLQSVILVVISATLTGVFGVIVARTQAKADERQHRRLDYLESRVEDVAGSVGANKRITDLPSDPDAAATPTSP